jgi:hypothetical protein
LHARDERAGHPDATASRACGARPRRERRASCAAQASNAALRVARRGASAPRHARLQGGRVSGTPASDLRAKTRRKREERDRDHRVFAPEGRQRRARRRLVARGSAAARARGPKLVALYPCALDRVRYTSDERVCERGCRMTMREINEIHAHRWGMQHQRGTRAVCALRAYARGARAVKRVDARDGRAEEG